MAAPSTDLSSPSIAGSVSLLDQSTATSIYWPWSSNDGARSSHDTSFHLLRVRRVARDVKGQAVDAIPVAGYEGLHRSRVLSAQLLHQSGIRIDFSRETRTPLVHTGLLISRSHHGRSAIHLTLLPGRAGLLSTSRFDIPWA